MMPACWTKNAFTISTDKTYLDLDVLHSFLSGESYWAAGVPRNILDKSIRNSALCFGVYEGNPAGGQAAQIGFARVISDLATFAYLADVFILPNYRGMGLSKWLMSIIVGHPELQNLRRFMLATNDAHGLYAQYGFSPIENPQNMMAIVRPSGMLYKSNF
ncbi:GNAT family N-acetyltransferase [Aneurinibacillus terranovensis]|uniref:GNAT family N-acetyltransferase n=1 Tax=Aneurinibacillus terranovensis TaxID=278991 RepID=UPI000404B046|nr:GNAT family N-acetyltransferase [Aneurinibacillus terranovensis]